MEHGFSRGYPFEIEDVWRQSSFRIDEPEETLFHPTDTDLPDLKTGYRGGLFNEDFRIAELGRPDGLPERPEDAESSVASSTGVFEASPIEPPAEIWTADLVLKAAERVPRLYTWEAFERKNVICSQRTSYISEAGPSIFDAAARRLENKGTSSGVLPQDVLLRALCNLCLGRSSLFFRWDAAKKSFTRTLTDVPITGFSATSCNSLIECLMDFGTKFRTLDDYGRSTTSYRRTCTAITTLRGCVVRALDCVEQHITSSIPHIRSIVQLQSNIQQSHRLFETLETLVGCVTGLVSDEDVISTLSDHINEIVESHSCLARTLRTLLARVSAPWLERLRFELGLTDDQLLLSSVVEFNETIVANNESLICGNERDDDRELPGFVDNEDRALIMGCKQSLRALRQYMPEHRSVVSQAHEPLLLQPEDSCRRMNIGAFSTFTDLDKAEHSAWSESAAQHDYLNAMETRMSEPLSLVQQQMDELQVDIMNVLALPEVSLDSVGFASPVAFNPIENLRPVLQAHARFLNTTALRHLFEACRLRHHLAIQHQYHLFGNGVFVTRLCKALFSTETQSAERKRGNIPTGETMGLRLGINGGQKWPPASSELRLTLAGILNETYQPDPAAASTDGPMSDELLGGLSFSIRELPDDEIDRVLDSGSVYALDFLRLQYTPPSGLEAVFTPVCLQAYDDIFRHLLRIIRVLDSTTNARQQVHKGRTRHEWTSKSLKSFWIEARNFISVVMTHFMDIGIRTSWRAFNVALDDIEASLQSDGQDDGRQAMTGFEDIQRLHEQCLEAIRTRLFLRRKHGKIRDGIDRVMIAILHCTASSESDDEYAFDAAYATFTDSIRELLQVMHTAVYRPGKMKADMDTAEQDTEAMSLLLQRLDWNGFYEAHAQ